MLHEDIERIRLIETRTEIRRIETSEIYRFHEAEYCDDCGKELDLSLGEDEVECNCGLTRHIEPYLRPVFEHVITTKGGVATRESPARTLDNRTDWGPVGRWYDPFAGRQVDGMILFRELRRYYQFLLFSDNME